MVSRTATTTVLFTEAEWRFSSTQVRGSPSDPDHALAAEFTRSSTERLISSDYIYDELLTLFRSRGHMERGKDWVAQVQLNRCEIVRVTSEDIVEVTGIFFRYADKEW